MDQTYIDRFNIDNILLRSIKQDIFVGTSKADLNDTAVINIIKDKSIISSKDLKKIKNSLHNVLYQEKIDNGVVLVTKFLAGTPLLEHLNQNNLNKKDREHILYEFIKGISKYSKLDKPLINVLIDETQIFVRNGILQFAELIKCDNLLQSPQEFKAIVGKIGAVSRRIYTYGLPEQHQENLVSDKILKFIDDLENDKLTVNNIGEILDYYKSLYFYSTSSRTKIDQAYGTTRNKRRTLRKQVKSPITKIATGLSIVVLMTCASTIFQLPYMLQGFVVQPPTASFDKINIADGWKFINKSTADGSNNIIKGSVWQVYKNDQIIDEKISKDLDMDFVDQGTYKVILKVQDQYEKWSVPYEKEFHMLKNERPGPPQETAGFETEILDNYEIIYDNPSDTFIDNSIFKKGNCSIRFDKSENGNNKSIAMKDLEPSNYSAFSMWVMSNSIQTIDFEIEGYKNEKLNYRNRVSFKLVSSNSWEMLNINGDISNIDELKISVLDHDSAFWIDDLTLDLYK
ncbi:MAG: hypothetical protein K0R93_1075 [Anaerosolibacter sp.]|jgi:hypothetical protein|uniref:hypothetical protein n=1 Tax=Anaerosolibacter sp. TaxID=1872527 RepID=UPI002620DF51|nr:hypothetical protein [Anaerosolibacter sp.]MDF2546177.1 hypothetical protein [Anaerosolibacter sp.]